MHTGTPGYSQDNDNVLVRVDWCAGGRWKNRKQVRGGRFFIFFLTCTGVSQTLSCLCISASSVSLQIT